MNLYAVDKDGNRVNVLKFAPVACDVVDIHVSATNGADNATIFEVRACE